MQFNPINALDALLNGEFDNSNLMAYGPLSVAQIEDIKRLLSLAESDHLPIPAELRAKIKPAIVEDQIFSAIYACQGRIGSGADIDAAFQWLSEEIADILKGGILFD